MSIHFRLIPSFTLPQLGRYILSVIMVYILVFSMALASTILRMYFVHDNFALAWRWFHDDILVGIFWYVGPTLMILFFIDSLLVIYHKKSFLMQFPRWYHWISFSCFVLTFTLCISQVFGGCIWFYFTEGWWVRFVPTWANDNEILVFYIVSCCLSAFASLTHYCRFLVVPKKVPISDAAAC